MKHCITFILLLLSKGYTLSLNHNSRAPGSRRTFLSKQGLVIASIATGTTIVPNVSKADFIGSGAMISKYPDLQYLVPIYTFNNALSVLSRCLSPEGGQKGLMAASRIVDNFFSGGLLSNKNIFKGLCVVYCQEIKYDDPYKERVKDDSNGRLKDCDLMLDSLKKMQDPLKQLVSENATSPTSEVLSYLDDAQQGIKRFLEKVPKEDMERVNQWMKALSVADTNRNGKLESEELASLSSEDVILYKAVGDFIGN